MYPGEAGKGLRLDPMWLTLGSSAESWLGHQAAYDLWELEQHKDDLRAVPLFASA